MILEDLWLIFKDHDSVWIVTGFYKSNYMSDIRKLPPGTNPGDEIWIFLKIDIFYLLWIFFGSNWKVCSPVLSASVGDLCTYVTTMIRCLYVERIAGRIAMFSNGHCFQLLYMRPECKSRATKTGIEFSFSILAKVKVQVIVMNGQWGFMGTNILFQAQFLSINRVISAEDIAVTDLGL